MPMANGDMGEAEATFSRIEPHVGTGTLAPDGWSPVAECDCLILVGLTGVGKTTVLACLSSALDNATLLPDRRTLTDRLMIPFVQELDRLPREPVSDRSRRFDYTRRYRNQFAGGMAHALSQLSVSPEISPNLLLFDGLRGENEIRHAAGLLPKARFLMLDTRDAVRIRRLLFRNDAFDTIAPDRTGAAASSDVAQATLSDLGISDLADLLTASEQQQLMDWLASGEVAAEDLIGKAKIVLAERSNYDPAATRNALLQAAPERTLIVDASVLPPDEIVERTLDWLGI